MELTKKQRRKIIAFDIALIFIILGVIAFGTHIYNKTAGTTCENNFDCKFHCPAGAFNENFIDIYRGPLWASDCDEGLTAVCENSRCKAVDAFKATSASECEKIEGGIYEVLCFFTLAKNTGNASYCSWIYLEPDRSHCYLEMAIELQKLSTCSKITDARLKEACVDEFVPRPPDYSIQTSYEGDCEKRPPYTVCLIFSDGYTWFVYDEILGNETLDGEGYITEIGRGKKSDYHHILYTNFVKEDEKG